MRAVASGLVSICLLSCTDISPSPSTRASPPDATTSSGVLDPHQPDTDEPDGSAATAADMDGSTMGRGLNDATPGDFLAPCEHNDECDSGYCVQSEAGQVCSRLCTDSCPTDWACRQAIDAGGSDPTFICIQLPETLCKPCQIDADCNYGSAGSHRCVSLGKTGRFCGLKCSQGSCPNGYGCAAVTLADGSSDEQCVPDSAECPCIKRYDGFSTPCESTNGLGACSGSRTCDSALGEWTACSARDAVEEVCDGLDNDCDGLVDAQIAAEPCAESNQWGSCGGQMHCTAGALDCDARVPTPEFCDLVDNDCNGAIDDDLGVVSCGVGLCAKSVLACDGGVAGVCDALAEATAEVCDGADNDCDGHVDEAIELGTTACGLGECSHVEANCVAGQPNICDAYQGDSAERCDGIDNDCNGLTDELWPAKGTACDGADPDQCAGGVWTCGNEGGGLLCAGDEVNFYEVCDGVDNDCNGLTDDGLGESPCGVGACAHVVFHCSSGVFQSCYPKAGASPNDVPDADFVDSNCDGIDGNPLRAFFVDSVSGEDFHSGSAKQPLKSIAAALAKASVGGRDQILVSAGTYPGALVLKSGIGIYGGYNAATGWARSAGNTTLITGHATLVSGTDIALPTTLSHLTIDADSASGLGASSYGIILRNADGVVLQDCTVSAGSGGPGQHGPSGQAGSVGSAGKDGKPGCEDGGSVFCSSCGGPPGGLGASAQCPGIANAGGGGGGSGKGDGSGTAGAQGSHGAPGGFGGSSGLNGHP
ncbi:MAG: hypothetical protein ACI9OJ_004768, partial [Myxococcota bacterium]